MFAVIKTGGKQYRVAVGQSIQVEKLPQVKGDAIAFDQVLLVSDGDTVTAGTPLVEGAQVMAVTAYNIAELPELLPRKPQTAKSGNEN